MKTPLNILVAETDLKVVTQLNYYLTSIGHNVFPCVTSGEDLMRHFELLNPSLIITDIHLNGQLDGIEAIARLERDYKIPYIFITTYDDFSRLITSYYLNPVSIIRKPIDQTNLYESIEKAQLHLELV